MATTSGGGTVENGGTELELELELYLTNFNYFTWWVKAFKRRNLAWTRLGKDVIKGYLGMKL